MKQLQLLAIISLSMVGAISNVYAGGPRLDYPSDSTSEGADCWVDGYDAGFAGKYDKARADRCAQENDEYNRSWGYACRDAGYMPDQCEGFKNIPSNLQHAQLQEENRRNCYDDGFEDGNSSLAFNKDRDHGCSEYNSAYRYGFRAGCESVEGNREDTCELIIEGHELYCPDNPDDPACTEFLHNATNKKPTEICNSPGGCFKDQDPERYCLNYNDPKFFKTVGDICDAGGFVKPEDAYCKGVTD